MLVLGARVGVLGGGLGEEVAAWVCVIPVDLEPNRRREERQRGRDRPPQTCAKREKNSSRNIHRIRKEKEKHNKETLLQTNQRERETAETQRTPTRTRRNTRKTHRKREGTKRVVSESEGRGARKGNAGRGETRGVGETSLERKEQGEQEVEKEVGKKKG